MKVVPIPALSDNYMYLLVDEKTNEAAIVDPVDISAVTAKVNAMGVKLTKALVTHHHYDHAGGTAELHKVTNGAVEIIGGDSSRIEKLDTEVHHDSKFSVGGLAVKCLHTPCHTKTHICYFVEDGSTNEKAVFTGDTLFISGCGRFFEGNAEQMNTALNTHLAALPDETKVYCGHEYTVTNLKFAATIEPSNEDVKKTLKWAQAEREANRFTVPSTIGDEKKFNPIYACRSAVGQSDAIATMTELRRKKDAFKA
ncbi:glyoxalase II chain A [Aphelenchoides avenae]|nr:glyoxalase II chain A [Aphelenchus avenae]